MPPSSDGVTPSAPRRRDGSAEGSSTAANSGIATAGTVDGGTARFSTCVVGSAVRAALSAADVAARNSEPYIQVRRRPGAATTRQGSGTVDELVRAPY
eukprot:6194356-Pleurochrysis_carterae.AAC.6